MTRRACATIAPAADAFIAIDGSARYLVGEAMLVDLTTELRGLLLDPIKTTIVQDQRCMTTWVIGKP